MTTRDGQAARIEQSPFGWCNGAWEGEVTIVPIEPLKDQRSMRATVRVTPDTLRRWKEVEINPFIEACAQLADAWRRAKPDAPLTLTLL